MQLLFIILASIGIIKADTLKVVTTIPELAEIAAAIGKKDIKVESLLSGSEDPHFLEASPYFISKVSNADVFCQVGLELEIVHQAVLGAWELRVQVVHDLPYR